MKPPPDPALTRAALDKLTVLRAWLVPIPAHYADLDREPIAMEHEIGACRVCDFTRLLAHIRRADEALRDALLRMHGLTGPDDCGVCRILCDARLHESSK